MVKVSKTLPSSARRWQALHKIAGDDTVVSFILRSGRCVSRRLPRLGLPLSLLAAIVAVPALMTVWPLH